MWMRVSSLLTSAGIEMEGAIVQNFAIEADAAVRDESTSRKLEGSTLMLEQAQ